MNKTELSQRDPAVFFKVQNLCIISSFKQSMRTKPVPHEVFYMPNNCLTQKNKKLNLRRGSRQENRNSDFYSLQWTRLKKTISLVRYYGHPNDNHENESKRTDYNNFKSDFMFVESHRQSLIIHEIVGILQYATKDSISSLHFSSSHHQHLKTLCLDQLNAMGDQGLDPRLGKGRKLRNSYDDISRKINEI